MMRYLKLKLTLSAMLIACMAQASTYYYIRMPDSTYSAQLRGVTGTTSAGQTLTGTWVTGKKAHRFTVTKTGPYKLYADPAGGSSYVLDSAWSGTNGKAVAGDDLSTWMLKLNSSYQVKSNGIGDTSIATAKIKNQNVTADKILDSTITLAKLNSTALDYIGAGGSVTNLADDVTLEDNGSALQIKDSGVSSAKVADHAITYAKLDTGAAGYIDVRKFGAVGDGSTDDRAAIQAALDYARTNNGGTVYFPSGTYIVTIGNHPVNATWKVGLEIGSNTIVAGAGIGNTIIKMDATEQNAHGILYNYQIAAGDSNITIRDLTVDGNATNQAVNTHHCGIAFLRVRNSTVQNVEVINCRGTATSGAGESFFFDTQLGSDNKYLNCIARRTTSDSCASGFSANSCTNILYSNCVSRSMSITNGFTHNGVSNIQYINCVSQLNKYHGFNSESSRDVMFINCTAGGIATTTNISYPFADSDSLGNAQWGINIDASNNTQIIGCTVAHNANGIYAHGDSTRIIGTTCASNTAFNVYNTETTSGYWLDYDGRNVGVFSAKDGLIGIRTSSPTRQLHVYGPAQAVANITDAGKKNGTIYIQDSDGSAGNGGTLLFGNGLGFHSAIKSYLIDGTDSTVGDLVFSNRVLTSDAFLTEAMRIKSSGKVGIGLTAPTNNLSVTGALSSLPALGTNSGAFGVFTGTTGGIGTYGKITGVLSNGNVYDQVQRVDGTATAYNLLLQPSGGSVGIGTTNPTSKLHVSGGVKADSSTIGAGGIWQRNWYYSAADSSLRIVFYNSTLARLDTVVCPQP